MCIRRSLPPFGEPLQLVGKSLYCVSISISISIVVVVIITTILKNHIFIYSFILHVYL